MTFPYGYNGYGTTGGDPTSYRVYGSWTHFILPYLDQTNAYNQFSPYLGMHCTTTQVTALETALAGLYATAMPAFYCPSSKTEQVVNYSWPWDTEVIAPAQACITSYVGCTGPNTSGDCASFSYPTTGQTGLTGLPLCQFIGYHFREDESSTSSTRGLFAQNKGKKSITRITDGTSNTIALGETTFSDNGIGSISNALFGGWAHSSTASLINWPGRTHPWGNATGFGSYHEGGAQFVMADGSVRFISESVSAVAFGAAGTISGNEIAGEF
ncbi:MAG: DUF1559 domain-containing protein [Planctomycetota bacterium]|nr:DUF1559 domain-containing protein [Planctomycetota bacterium]